MATLFYDTMVANAQLYCVDQDPTDPGIAALDWSTLINDAVHDFVSAFPDLLVSTIGAIPLATSVSSYTLITTTGYRDIISATHQNGLALERSDWAELNMMIATEAFTTSVVTNMRWAALKSPTSVLTWTIKFYPAPTVTLNGQSVSFMGHAHPNPLSSGSQPPVGDAESRWIARIAGARAAALLGRPDNFVENLWRDIPKNIQTEMRTVDAIKRPSPRPDKLPV